MNFSQPNERELLHSRRIYCDGYLRADGLWDMDAQVVDTRSFESPSSSGSNRSANEPLHSMGMRVTIDNDMVIRAVEALTEHGPYPDCLKIAFVYKDLVGMKIGPGFLLAAKQRFRGRQGCTHFTELLGSVATTAVQTLMSHASRNKARGVSVPVQDSKASTMINSCYAFRSDGEVVLLRWPQSYSGPAR